MPSDDLPTTTYAVLGLLTFGPNSGYEIAQLAEHSIANFWTIAKSQVYGELARLEEIGYVESTAVRQERLPDKRVFELTAPGEKALEEWLNSPTFEDDRFRSGLLVKMMFARNMRPDRLDELLAQYRASYEQVRDKMQMIVKDLSGEKEALHSRATALFGQRISEAIIGWVDEVGAEITSERKKKR